MPVHPGTNKSFVLQRGTFACVNTVVPHTGKAVEGVWPRVVQGWEYALKIRKKRIEKIKANRVTRRSLVISTKIGMIMLFFAPFANFPVKLWATDYNFYLSLTF